MSKRIFVAISAASALAALFTTGCFFGGTDDASTQPIVEDPKTTDSLPKVRHIVPGLYVGDYSWIDSGKAGLESEFMLDTNGSYRLFWVSENEAVYDQRGAWIQKDTSFFFSHTQETWVSSGVFADFSAIEDDTNTVRNVTDSTFTRREWTPLRQKPYWIAYHRVTYPKLNDGVYALTKTFGSDSTKVVYDFSIELKAGKFVLTVDEDSLPNFQADAKYYQIGSFLVTDQNRNREADSTHTYSEWAPFDGAILKRLQTVSDTAFTMWNPPSFFEAGNWDVYRKKPAAN
jgi:hypothetical protein